MGKQKLAEVIEDDHILKWQVPYAEGSLTLVGYNNGKKVDEYILNTQGALEAIDLRADRTEMQADGYDTAVITLELRDEKGHPITDQDQTVTFEIKGAAKNLGVDNGWERNVQPHKSNTIVTHEGRAVVFVQSTKTKGDIVIKATANGITSNEWVIKAE